MYQWLVFFINSNKVFCGTTSFTLCIIEEDREMDSTWWNSRIDKISLTSKENIFFTSEERVENRGKKIANCYHPIC